MPNNKSILDVNTHRYTVNTQIMSYMRVGYAVAREGYIGLQCFGLFELLIIYTIIRMNRPRLLCPMS